MKTIKAFIVDDDVDAIRLAATILSKAGYEVASETDSRQALSRILKEQPDCVLLDIMMPDLDGLQLCGKIRATPRLAKVKVVMVSAKSYKFDREQAFRFGADAYFVKPIKPKSLLEGLERLFSDPTT
ncbi:MAG: response regulator [Magnetococcales bacterium]|nr:response regulator [Magnetococcales bacterium]